MQKPSKTFNPLPYADFRSDTATAPTPEMFAAMMKSSLGDDVYNEDESVKTLERYVATLCGHEAALYCASGTMTNQLAHRVHLSNPPQSAMVDIRSHVFNYEAGGISFHSQAAVYPIMPANGQYLTVEDIASRLVLDVDVHYAPTRVISLENTLNGTIMPIEEMVRIRQLTREHKIKLHLDGARLWHAAIATGISMRDYCSNFDTISLCLSKGIGAPIGSVLVGSHETIKKARHFRLLFGGAWRQAGFLAEAALWCIKTNWPTMEDTHRQARWLERVFRQVGCNITNPVDTNMIWVDTSEAGFTVEELMDGLAKEGIKMSGSGSAARIVLHYQISDEVVGKFIDVLRMMARTPRMKVAVDLIKASMREQPSSIYESDGGVSPTTSAPRALPSPTKLMHLDETEIQSKDGDNDAFHENGIEASNAKLRCLFEETQEEPNTPQPLSNSPLSPESHSGSAPPRAFPNSYSSPSFSTPGRIRPMSAYGVLDSSFVEEIDGNHDGQRKSRHMQDGYNEEGESGPRIRRTQSLDFAEAETHSKDLNGAHPSDTKKMNKLQYRLAHNLASKALKRASVRIVRWGSLLSREP